MNAIEEMLERLTDLRLSLRGQCSREAVLSFGLTVDSLGYQSAEELRNLAVSHAELLQEAIGWHRLFLEDHDNDPIVINNLGVMLTNSGRASEGRAHFARAIALLPTDRNLHENLGIADVLTCKDRSAWHKVPEALQPGELTLVAYFDPQAM